MLYNLYSSQTGEKYFKEKTYKKTSASTSMPTQSLCLSKHNSNCIQIVRLYSSGAISGFNCIILCLSTYVRGSSGHLVSKTVVGIYL